MIKWLIKILWGHPKCDHEWKVLEKIQYNNARDRYLYLCIKCGKFKKIRL
jgi:hypothetical protein